MDGLTLQIVKDAHASLNLPPIVVAVAGEAHGFTDFADLTCHYVTCMVGSWATDTPGNGAKHPWMLSQAIRLEAARVASCVSSEDYMQAVSALNARFRTMLPTVGEPRTEAPNEVADVWKEARKKAATKSKASLATELGSHAPCFSDDVLGPDFGPQDRHLPPSTTSPTSPGSSTPPPATDAPAIPLLSYGIPTAEFLRLSAKAQQLLAEDPRLGEATEHVLRQGSARLVAAELAHLDTYTEFTLDPYESIDISVEQKWTINGVLAEGGNVVVIAEAKAGKTVLSLNMCRSLTTGQAFLDEFPVDKQHKVAYLNYEVTGAQLARWVTDMGVPAGSLFLGNLRGVSNPLATAQGRARLVAFLIEMGATVLFIDPLQNAFWGDNINDATQVALFFATVSEVAQMAGIEHVIVVAHAGKADRGQARGSSVIEGWPDTIISMTVDDGERFLSGRGRDVLIPESALDFDPLTREITYTGGENRQESVRRTTKVAAKERVDGAVLRHLAVRKDDIEPPTGNQLSKEIGGKKAAIYEAIDNLSKAGLINKTQVPRGFHYSITALGKERLEAMEGR